MTTASGKVSFIKYDFPDPAGPMTKTTGLLITATLAVDIRAFDQRNGRLKLTYKVIRRAFVCTLNDGFALQR